MIVEITLNYERTSGDFDTVWMDTDKLRTYTPLTNEMPQDIVSIIENTDELSIEDGPNDVRVLFDLIGLPSSQPDWWSEESDKMFDDDVITYDRPSKIDKEFEIHFC